MKAKNERMDKKMLNRVCELMSHHGESWKKVEPKFVECIKYMGVELPWCVNGGVGSCNGLCKAKGLYLRCMKEDDMKGGFCKGCRSSFREEEGRPLNGLWSERGNENWKPPNGGKVKTWGMYLKGKGLTKEDGLKILKMHGIEETKIPESEWKFPEKKTRGTGATQRFVPKKGKSKSVTRKSGNFYHHGNDDSKPGCQVRFWKETGKVEKISSEKWPAEAHAKFVELYGELDKEGFGVDKPKKKKATNSDEIAFAQKLAAEKVRIEKEEREKMAAELEAAKEKMRLEFEKKLQEAAVPKAPESKNQLPVPKKKKVKKINLKKKENSAEKAKKEAARLEKEAKEKEEAARLAAEEAARVAAEEAKRKEEELARKKLEEEKKHDEMENDTSDSEMDEDAFEDSDDEDGFVFNPYEYNGVKYHLDDGELYHFPPNDEGELEQFGSVHEDGTVTEM